MLKTVAKSVRRFIQRILLHRFSEEEKNRQKEKQKLELLKKLLLEYYSSFALTIFQGVVFFTQETLEDIMLMKPAYNEAQERYNTVISRLNELKRSLNKEIRSRIDRIVKEGAAIIVESSESIREENGRKPQKTQYDFIIGIMAVQKQCLDLVGEIEDRALG